MKKKLLLVLVFFLGFFFPFFSAQALTEIHFNEKANGAIRTTLHFEEGFVGGIDITFHVTGNVFVQDFQFSDKIASNSYGKEFQYDGEKQFLTIRVTTGGIGTSHNLLNEKKELELGTIVLGTTSSQNENYQLSETTFQIVDNTWASQTIEQSHIVLGDETSFVYQVTNSDSGNQGENENPGQSSTSGENQNSSSDENQNSSSGVNSSQNSTTTNQEESTSPSDSVVSDEKDSSTSKPEDETSTNQDNKKKPSHSKDVDVSEDKKETKSVSWVPLAVGIGTVVVLGGGIYFLVIKRKKDDTVSF